MLKLLRGRDLAREPRLALAMFRDRAAQFRDRMGWPVAVAADGGERDAYDALDPLYVVATDPGGGHAGSLRFLPTTGRTMLAEHFGHLPGAGIADPGVWECTRFCLAPGAGAEVSGRLLLAAAEVGQAAGLSHALAVFDAPMGRLYARLGWAPEVLGQAGTGAAAIRLGRWAFGPGPRDRLAARAGKAAAAAARAAVAGPLPVAA